MSLIRIPCTLHQANVGGLDEYGDATQTETDVSTTCYIEQTTSFEQGDNDRNIEVSRWKVYLPAGLTVTGADSLTVLGDRYAFYGDPWPAQSARTGQVHHIEGMVTRS